MLPTEATYVPVANGDGLDLGFASPQYYGDHMGEGANTPKCDKKKSLPNTSRVRYIQI